jgi:hypothetical protein
VGLEHLIDRLATVAAKGLAVMAQFFAITWYATMVAGGSLHWPWLIALKLRISALGAKM